MKISASIYSNKNKTLAEIAQDLVLHNIDMAHVDCNDDGRVFEDISWINKNTDIPVDLHIIAEHPEQYFDLIASLDIKTLSLQYENIKNKEIYKDPRLSKTQVGLAIMTDTPIDVFLDYADICDFVLLMSTTPGQSGGTFDAKNFSKIHAFKKKYPHHKIQVDGGVNGEVSFILRNLNVDSVVSGSYLMNAPDIAHALMHLKYKHSDSHFYVRDIMIPLVSCPHIHTDATILEALRVVDTYKMGFVNIVDDHNQLLGILSNADIRRAFISILENKSEEKLSYFINSQPITIEANNTVTEMLLKIKSLEFPILFMPVVDTENKLMGVITFNNLIKGEI